MTPERIKELAALSAAGALECPEAAEWARLLSEGNTLAWQELAAHREALAAATLATTPARTPSPDLKARILQKIAATTPPVPPPAVASRSSPAATPAPAGFLNIRKQEGGWLPLPYSGIRVKLLSLDRARNYAMIYAEIDPGVTYPEHHHSAGEEMYILTGDLMVNGELLEAGDFHHAEADTDHVAISSPHGCTALMLIPAETLLLAMG